MTDFPGLLGALTDAGVEFIVVGGFAGVLHGSALPTRDLDIVYARDRANLEKLAAALAEHAPYLRGAPAGLPFQLDAETLAKGLNFTLVTNLGAIDLLGEIAGGGGHRTLSAHVVTVTVFGRAIRCLDLDTLIRVKRAAGRLRDLQAVAELEALREERDRPPPL